MSSKISDLAAITAPTLTALFPLVNDPAGTPANKVMTTTSLRKFIWPCFNVKDYGALCDGTTDDSTAVIAAIAACYAAGGGEVYIPRTSRIDSQLLIPNDGGGTPKQVSITLRGDGCSKNTTTGSGVPNGGTILDLRYAGAGVAKIDTRGTGFFSIQDMSIVDNSGTPNTVPFFQTTNTSVYLNNVAFYGNPARTGTACDQDAIVLGGTGTSINGTASSPFQGYGTVIQNCFFDRIRRCVYGRTYANGISIVNNTVWNKCGSNIGDGAAIEFLGDATSSCSGNVISGNTIEVTKYPYAVKLTYANGNTLGPNGIYDATATHLAAYRFDTSATYNDVVDGYRNDAYPLISEVVGSATTNSVHTAHQSQPSNVTQAINYYGRMRLMLNNGVGAVAYTSTGDQGYMVVGAGNNPYPVINMVTIAATQVTDGVTTNGSTTVTSATASFVAADVGLPIGGTGIPGFSLIAKVNSSTSIELTKNATVTNTGVTLNIGRAGGSTQTMTGFARHHILATGSAGSGATDTGSGTSPSISVAGTDLSGTVTLTTGTTPPAGSAGSPQLLCHWNHAINYTSAPRIVLFPRNAGAAQLLAVGLYAVTATNKIELYSIGATPASTACIFDWIAMQ